MPTKLEAGFVHSPGANTNAAVTLGAPGATKCNVLWRVDWSYSATPTAGRGNLTITDGGATVLELDIIAGGPGYVEFVLGAWGDPAAEVVVTLNADDAGALGKVNVQASVEEQL